MGFVMLESVARVGPAERATRRIKIIFDPQLH
jgi:hypothetical protein